MKYTIIECVGTYHYKCLFHIDFMKSEKINKQGQHNRTCKIKFSKLSLIRTYKQLAMTIYQ